MLTEEALRALQPGQRLLDTYGQEWTVACSMMAGQVGVRRSSYEYRTIGPASGFRRPTEAGDAG